MKNELKKTDIYINIYITGVVLLDLMSKLEVTTLFTVITPEKRLLPSTKKSEPSAVKFKIEGTLGGVVYCKSAKIAMPDVNVAVTESALRVPWSP